MKLSTPAKKPLTPAQRRMLAAAEEARGMVHVWSHHESAVAFRLEQLGYLSIALRVNADYHITDAGRAALKDTTHAE